MAISPVRIGMLTPSSNTVLEPYTAQMFMGLNGAATVHFSRFRVVEISLGDASQSQFSIEPILEAAARLAEARVSCIAWNGTSAAWLGLQNDELLCQQIEEATGCTATSTILAYEKFFQRQSVKRLGLVTPYLSEVQDRIIENYAARDIEIVADQRLEDPGNFSFSEYEPDQIEGMVREVAKAKPDAIAIMCTNFRGAPIARCLEEELGIAVVDSVAITAAQTLQIAGVETSSLTKWGSVFSAN